MAVLSPFAWLRQWVPFSALDETLSFHSCRPKFSSTQAFVQLEALNSKLIDVWNLQTKCLCMKFKSWSVANYINLGGIIGIQILLDDDSRLGGLGVPPYHQWTLIGSVPMSKSWSHRFSGIWIGWTLNWWENMRLLWMSSRMTILWTLWTGHIRQG